MARVAYRKSSRPKACAVCGYDTHYAMCHIRPINDFLPTDTVVSELCNLVALCPNHHWEFDHGKLSTAFITEMVEAAGYATRQ